MQSQNEKLYFYVIFGHIAKQMNTMHAHNAVVNSTGSGVTLNVN